MIGVFRSLPPVESAPGEAAMRRIELDDDEIVRLYVEERLRAKAIGEMVGCSDAKVYAVLEAARIPRSSRARLPLDEAIRLYQHEGWSLTRLGARFGVCGSTVRRHLQEAGVRTRDPTESRQPFGRRSCPTSQPFRAYLLGLVWGDFSVRRHGRAGQTLSVGSSTTDPCQVDLIREVFSPFGPVYDWNNRTFRASLDLSFDFLEAKYEGTIPDWVRTPEIDSAFAAGYIDAEGSFGVYEGRARFKLDAYDRAVLHWLHAWCRRIGVRSRLRRVAQEGSPRPDGGTFNRDLWRVNVNAGPALLRLIATLEPYLRHAGRRDAASRARANVLHRLRSRIGDQLEPLPLSPRPH
jgi:hypothetical protein